MRVLAIRGGNLASLAGDFVVDLEKGDLGGVGLYAITGPVGAGKSTLLDALCLALYDRTPRLGQGGVRIGREGEANEDRLRDQDVRGILRRGCASAFAEVDFVGRGGGRFRARWSVRRAHDRSSGRLQSQALELWNIATGEQIGGTKTEVLAEIRERVGLTFEQFCRSVLLAQGDFAAFLKAAAKERAALLERMTGSELYGRLSTAAHEREREQVRELLNLQERRAEHSVLPDRERKSLVKELAKRERQVARDTKELEAARTVFAWHQLADRLTAELQAAEAEQASLRQQLAVATKDRAATQAAFRERLQQSRRKLAASVAELAEQQQAATRWLQQHEQLQDLTVRWPRWQGLLERWVAGAAALETLEQERLTNEEQLEVAAERLRHREQQRTRARRNLDQAEAARTEAAELLTAADPKAWRDRQRRAQRDRLVLQKLDGRLGAIEAAEQEAARTRERVERAERAAERAGEIVACAGAELGPLKVQWTEADRAWQHAQRVRDLKDHRHDLRDGEPCPLCGAEEHPFGCDDADGLIEAGLGDRVQELRAELERVEKQITVAQTDVQNQRQVAEDAGQELAMHEKAVVMLVADAEFIVAELAPDMKELGFDRGQIAASMLALSAELEEILEREREWAGLEAAKNAADAEVDRAREAFRLAEDEHRVADREWVAVQQSVTANLGRRSQLEAGQQGLLEDLAEVFDQLPSASTWRADLERQRQEFVVGWEHEVAEYRHRQHSVDHLGRQRRSMAAALEHLEGSGDPNLARLELLAGLLAGRGAEEPDEVLCLQKLLDGEVRNRRREQRQLEELETRCSRAQTVVEERQRARTVHEKRRPKNPHTDLAAAKGAFEAAQQAWDAGNEKRHETRVRLEVDDRARKAIEELEPRIRQAEETCRVWQALSAVIGSRDGARFRVFAQSLTLDVLLQNANHHLGELAPRYRLMRVPGHDLDLQVVDLDMAAEIRGVHSLSGGETFLVSLALALGLASLSAQDTPVESLFIDEGFGTLDPQTLDVALSTLDALQASGRKVGLISHVPGMAERVGVQVMVAPEGGGRSRVEVRSSF